MENAFIFHETPARTCSKYEKSGGGQKGIHCFNPFGCLDFLNLMANAKLVLTDSGGIQEETTMLDIPCITLRDSTERPITLTQGANVLAGSDPEKIVEEAEKVLSGFRRKGNRPEMWDGQTARRIVEILID